MWKELSFPINGINGKPTNIALYHLLLSYQYQMVHLSICKCVMTPEHTLAYRSRDALGVLVRSTNELSNNRVCNLQNRLSTVNCQSPWFQSTPIKPLNKRVKLWFRMVTDPNIYQGMMSSPEHCPTLPHGQTSACTISLLHGAGFWGSCSTRLGSKNFYDNAFLY